MNNEKAKNTKLRGEKLRIRKPQSVNIFMNIGLEDS